MKLKYVHAVLCCCTCPLCVCVGGGGGGGGGAAAGVEYCEENSYSTLEPNQSYIYNNSSGKSKWPNERKNILYFLFWLTTKHGAHGDSLFHCPVAHAAAGQGEGWCLQGMAI